MSACKPLWNILEPSHGGATLVEDPGEVNEGAVAVAVAPVVFVPFPLARAAVGLAWWAGDEEIDKPSQRLGVHSADAIAPNRSAPQGLRAHPGQECGRCCCVPLDVTHGANPVSKSVKGEFNPGVVEPGAGEDAK